MSRKSATSSTDVNPGVETTFGSSELAEPGGGTGKARGHQGTGRTGLHAFTAADATAVAHRIVKIEGDFRRAAASGHGDDIVDLDFAAGTYTEPAMNAGIEIDRHRRMAGVAVGSC